MGLLWKALVLFVGLASLTLGAWPLSLVSFAYLAVSLFRRRQGKGDGGWASRLPSSRHAIAGLCFVLALAAFASGGAYSVLVFLGAAVTATSWPLLTRGPALELVPVEGSILLRSRWLPFIWHCFAEVKPGTADYPRSLASFSGDLAVFPRAGKAYAVETCIALGRREAEEKMVERLRRHSPGRGLSIPILPLDSRSSEELCARSWRNVGVKGEDLLTAASSAPALVRVYSEHGRVRRLGVFELEGFSRPKAFPGPGSRAGGPLLWELLESLGRIAPWPNPDGLSGLVESIRSTAGEPLGERLDSLESSGSNVLVRSLGGDKFELSRAQLRALVAIYS